MDEQSCKSLIEYLNNQIALLSVSEECKESLLNSLKKDAGYLGFWCFNEGPRPRLTPECIDLAEKIKDRWNEDDAEDTDIPSP